MAKSLHLIGKKWLLEKGIVFMEKKHIDDKDYLENEFLVKYNKGYYKVSLLFNMYYLTADNYIAVLRRKVLELYYLNPNLFDDNYPLFREVIKRIMDTVDDILDLNAGEVDDFIDYALDTVGYNVKHEDVRVKKYFVLKRGAIDAADYEDFLTKYRSLIANFNNTLKTDHNQDLVNQAISSIMTSVSWLDADAIQSEIKYLFDEDLTTKTIKKYMKSSDYAEKINDYKMKTFHTLNKSFLRADNQVIDAIKTLRAAGSEVSKREVLKITNLSTSSIYIHWKSPRVKFELKNEKSQPQEAD